MAKKQTARTTKSSKRGLCKKGLHRMSASNTYQHPSKGPECRECKRSYMREYMREVRASSKSSRPSRSR